MEVVINSQRLLAEFYEGKTHPEPGRGVERLFSEQMQVP